MQDAWLKAAVHDCQARPTRYIETLGARRRYLPDITARERSRASRAERQAVNGICQARPAERDELVGSLTCDWLQGQKWICYVPFVVLLRSWQALADSCVLSCGFAESPDVTSLDPRVQGIAGLWCEAYKA